MLVKKTMQKTKKFIFKSLQNLKKFLFGSYENIPRTLFLNPLSCTSINQRTHHLDHIYPEFSSSHQSSHCNHDENNADCTMKHIYQRTHHLDHIYPEFSSSHQSSHCNHDENNADCTMKHILSIDADNCAGVITTSCEMTNEMKHEVVKAPRKVQQSNSNTANGGTRTSILAQKMKELEMMDVGDVDHTLDVEEALHYYSRLTCPEYVDMVNKFFIGMYTDFNGPSISKSSSSRRLSPLTPQPSIGISSSSKVLESALTRQHSIRKSSTSKRLDSAVTPQSSIRINSSSRRLGPLTLCFD